MAGTQAQKSNPLCQGPSVTWLRVQEGPSIHQMDPQTFARSFAAQVDNEHHLVTPGCFGFVPENRRRWHARLFFAHRDRPGEVALMEFGPGLGDGWELTLAEIGLHHPGEVKKLRDGRPGRPGRPWDYHDPFCQLHFVVYGMPRTQGAADSIMNMQHGGEVRAEWVRFPHNSGVGRGLHLLVIKQSRHCEATPENPEGWTIQAPRGNTDPTRALARKADGSDEFAEEVGAATYINSPVIHLPESDIDPFHTSAIGVNADNSWFVRYPDPVALQEGRIRSSGATFTAREVPEALVERIPNTRFLRFKPGAIAARSPNTADAENALREQIGEAFFIPITDALSVREGYTGQAAGRLVAHLHTLGIVNLSVA